jgi:hypothetical protein
VYGRRKKRSFTSDPMGNKKGGTKTNTEEVEKKNHMCRTRGDKNVGGKSVRNSKTGKKRCIID